MSRSLLGIHHITAITSDADKNIDFYTRLLGLRLVKVTVSFDVLFKFIGAIGRRRA